MTKDGATTTNKYNNLNQLTSSTENKDGKETSNKTYSYDKNGNQTKEKDSETNVTVENTYDVDNRLSISITTNGEKEVVNQENLYNGNGKRIQKKEGNNIVNYFYQDGVVLYTTDKDGNKTSQNFVGTDGNVIGTTRYGNEGFKYYTYNKDVQGSTTSVVGEDGTSLVAYDYDDFGITTIIGDATFYNEVCYTGGIYDVSTGLYYLNARYYDPNNGRFITRDTYRGEVRNPSTLHLYTYCSNNPINYVDPSGHTLVAISHVVGANFLIGYQRSKGIVISSSGRIGVFKGGSINLKIGTGSISASTGIEGTVYGNTSIIADLKNSSFYANCSASVYGANVSFGATFILKTKKNPRKNRKAIPYISFGAGTSSSAGFDCVVGVGFSQVIAFPYNVAWYIRHRNDNKKHTFTYRYFGEKQTIKCTNKNITVSYGGISIQFANYKSFKKK